MRSIRRPSSEHADECRVKSLANQLIYIGIGGNLPTPNHGSPRTVLGAALRKIETLGLQVAVRSPWYESAPVPVSDQPWYVNGVAGLKTDRSLEEVLGLLLAVEEEFGRVRTIRNVARTIDLDILSRGATVINAGERLIVPHPRMSERAFVLLPLRDIAPDWAHPETGKAISSLVQELDPDQDIRRMDDGSGLFGTEWDGTEPPPELPCLRKPFAL